MKQKEQKRVEGQVRNETWAKLSPAEKLADLDRRLGKSVGAARQRKLLEETK